jgi:hypothetical protein
MGFRASWFAARGADKAEMLPAVGFEEAEAIEYPFDEDYAFMSLPGGWSVVFVQEYDWASRQEWAALVPSAAESFSCEASTIVMFSRAWSDRDGVRLWTVAHNPEDEEGLKIEGAPPTVLAGIHEGILQEAAENEGDGADYVFDTPLKLSGTLCGFCPEDPLPEGTTVTKLVLLPGSVSAPPPRPVGLFGKLRRALFG